MKCGPRPSRARVDDGACTQLRRKNELPMTNRGAFVVGQVGGGKENAVRPSAKTVVSPPVRSSEPRPTDRASSGRWPQRGGAAARAPAARPQAQRGCMRRSLAA